VPAYVLDTSAIMALLNDEPGQEVVQGVLAQAQGEAAAETPLIYLPFLALMEAEYLMLRRHLPEDVERYMELVLGWPAQVVESNPIWRHRAATLKASGGLSVADAWIAALALYLEATLVHKDPEFDRIQGLQVVRLPS
jgi:predicted nucleic acid-binding protein